MTTRTRVFLVLLNNPFLIIFVCENHNKMSTTFQIFVDLKIVMFYEISPCTLPEYYSKIMHSKFLSFLKKMAEKMVEDF